MKNPIKYPTIILISIFIIRGCNNTTDISSPDSNSSPQVQTPKSSSSPGKTKTKPSTQSGELEDQYLFDDFNGDGYCDVAVRRGSLIMMDFDRDGSTDRSFYWGNGNSERGYYTYEGGLAIVRGNTIYLDTDADGNTDDSLQYGNGATEDEYLFGGYGVTVRRDNLLIYDTDLDGTADDSVTVGYGDSEDQYTDSFCPNGWAVRRGNTFYFYGSGSPYSYGYGNSEDGYFFGNWNNNLAGCKSVGVLRGNTLYYDTNRDGQADGNFSYGTGLK
jgi:hypothetical protein